MATLSGQLYNGCIDNLNNNNINNMSKGELLLHSDGVQIVGGRGVLYEAQETDPFSSCLMDMEIPSNLTEDFMIEEYTRAPDLQSFITSPHLSALSLVENSGMIKVEEIYNQQWTQIPGFLQQQLFTHYGLYLKEIQQVLDMQLHMDISSSDSSSSPSSSSPSSPSAAHYSKGEKRKKSIPSFKVEHYKLQSHLAKRPKREESEPLSPNYNDDDFSSSPSSFADPSTPTLRNSNNLPSPPSKPYPTVAEELANALLPSVSQIEEEIRAGTSSPSAATTVIELSKRPELLTLKQSDAARIMGISTSVLSKRWREATRGKKWPHRIHHKLKRAAIC